VLGKLLQAARKAAGLTQEQVAAKAHMSREHVSRLERDEYRPTVEMLIRVAKAIGVEAWPIVKAAEEAGGGSGPKGRLTKRKTKA
jgi:transcriptional regulator with XRE-family HTH domain